MFSPFFVTDATGGSLDNNPSTIPTGAKNPISSQVVASIATPSPYGVLGLDSPDKDTDEDDFPAITGKDSYAHGAPTLNNMNGNLKRVGTDNEEDVDDYDSSSSESSDDDIICIGPKKAPVKKTAPTTKPSVLDTLKAPLVIKRKPRDHPLRTCARITNPPCGKFRVEFLKCLTNASMAPYFKEVQVFNATHFRWHLTMECLDISMHMRMEVENLKSLQYSANVFCHCQI